jgi:alkyl hydroperoxide reductase subunit AhpC
MNQLGGLAEDYSMFEEKGAQVIAMAVQPQEEAALSVERSEAQFPILADREHAVADVYGVYNHFSDSEAAASVFIISKDSVIIWESIAAYQTQRVPSQTILENLPGAEEAKTEQPAAVEEEAVPKVSVTLNLTVHSSDLGGYA